MGFPEQLKKARLSMGYTQQQVAGMMAIANSTYCGYETGKRQPDIAKIKHLTSILNTSADILLETGFAQEPPSKSTANTLDDGCIKQLARQKTRFISKDSKPKHYPGS